MDCFQSSSATLQVQDAVAASGVATRWRYLWCNLRQLNFDGRDNLHNNMDSANVIESEREKYIKQVNSVIRSYNHPTVNDFRINYDLNGDHKHVIDEWLEFASNRKVEFLELDLTDRCPYINSKGRIIRDFASKLMLRRNSRCFPMVVMMLPDLKKLILKFVDVTKEVFEAILKNSPHLEMISIHDSLYLDHIVVSGQPCNLTHFEIVDIGNVRSIYLSDLDNLVSFTCKGGFCGDLRLTRLPKLMELDLDMGYILINDVFDKISSCALSLQSLSLSLLSNLYPSDRSVPMFPNLKKLRLAVGCNGDNILLFLASIMNACPNLKNFCIKPCWTLPIIRKKKPREATNPDEHLKVFEIVDYIGRKCDFELVSYIIHILKKK